MSSRIENKQLVDELYDRITQQQAIAPTFIVEISGTPNSGKTTSVLKFENLFNRKKMGFKFIHEMATKCPINNKLLPEFNYWTGTSTMTKFWELLYKKPTVIICERGIFDALCWLEFHYKRKSISEFQLKKMADFYLNDSLTKYKKYVLELVCSPKCAVDREYMINDYHIPGTIVNKEIVQQINQSIKTSSDKYNDYFDRIETVDSTNMDMESTVTTVFNKILHYLLDNI